MHKDGRFLGVITVTASDGGIDRVLWMVVPEKLALLSSAPAGGQQPRSGQRDARNSA
jgi:hypothetical protein